MGQPWCATYQFWLEAKSFGLDTALAHFHMSRNTYSGYNCFCIYDAFEKAGKVTKQPMSGSTGRDRGCFQSKHFQDRKRGWVEIFYYCVKSDTL